MAEFRKITDLPLAESITDDDLFIMETLVGTKSVKIGTVKGDIHVTPEDIGLGNVDNTHDIDKPISTATQAALDLKAGTSYVQGTYLSKADASNDYLTKNSASGTYLSKTEAASGYATKTELSAKQNTISDLEDIREGAGLGATAVQPATLNGYVPTSRKINGQALTNDITIDALPTQSGHSGEFLTTDGTNASWAEIQQVIPVDDETIKLNTSGEMGAVGLVNKNTSGSTVYDWVGTNGEAGALGDWTSTSGSYSDIVTGGNNIYIEHNNFGSAPKDIYKLINNTWTKVHTCTEVIKASCFGDGKFVLVHASSIEYSTDGENWQQITQVPASNIEKIFYGNGVFLAWGLNTAYVSSDLTNWDSYSFNTDNYLQGFMDGKFYAFYYNSFSGGSDKVKYSINGKDWESINITLPDSSARLGCKIFKVKDVFIFKTGNGQSSNAVAYYTKDFVTFTQISFEHTNIGGDHFSSNGSTAIITVTNNSNYITGYYITHDGITWQYKEDLPSQRRGYPYIDNERAFIAGYIAEIGISKAHPEYTCFITDSGKIVKGNDVIADNTSKAVTENNISTLTTTSKTIVGAINEINGLLDGVEEQLSQI